MVFFKFILNLFNRFFNLIDHNSLLMQIVVSIAFYGMTYLLLFKFQMYNLFGLFIAFIISFVVCTFILDKFNYSEYIFIRILQKFFFYNLVVIVISLMFIYFIYISMWQTTNIL